ncbi:hypothetical protein EV644_11429 [Kribbella orskensis]|uniref:DUF456 domain-containing protein n=1 Tax=Kribbella orskensis TaxID=2512216 RepID=A0ABY2BG87_9ACTN|nr:MULTISPECIES: DUF456 domain-containing protein [Kribbella]TCN35774.1 hypothetical protein EV642_11529 [Kribbella sp. VKM Ac-2500]TCO17381.1 hypothetical protein EV644_11429 [Kribbella orskensis]
MNSVATFLVGVAIFVGIVGIVIPILPGAILSLAAILVWALEEQSPTGWIVLSAAVVLIGASQVVKYIVPERRLRESGVPRRSILIGVLLGIVGFFVIPVIGMFIGFPLGVYVSERQRLGAHAHAWTSTKHALRATGLSILIELIGASLAAAIWLAAVLFLV